MGSFACVRSAARVVADLAGLTRRPSQSEHTYSLVERFIRDLVEGGCLDGKAFDSLVQFSF